MSRSAVSGTAPGGPYSPGIVAEGRFVYVSGQGPSVDGTLQLGSIEDETRLTLDNVGRVLEAAGVATTGNRLLSASASRRFIRSSDEVKDAFGDLRISPHAPWPRSFPSQRRCRPGRLTCGRCPLLPDAE